MPSWIGIALWRDPQKRRNNLMNKVFIAMCTPALLTAISLGQSSVQAQASDSVSPSSVASAHASGAPQPSQTAARPAAQGVAASGTSQPSTVAAGSAIHATLAKPVDARHCKPGDEVMAKTSENVKSDGQVVLPKGSKIVGHVTEAKAFSKGKPESAVGIAFDYAVLKDGREVPLAASIQAIASPQASSPADQGDNSMIAAGSTGARASGGNAAGGVLAGSGRAVGTTGGTLVNTSSAVGSVSSGTLQGASSASGALSSSSHGAIGLKGISLDSAANSSTRGSLITCQSQNVHLDAGTQMILEVGEK
jgi:hypothetical protein